MTRRQKALTIGAVILFVIFSAVGSIVLGGYVDRRAKTDQIVIDQSRQNQRHIDCVIAVLFRQNPPLCEGVKDQLIADGILPPGFPESVPQRGAS